MSRFSPLAWADAVTDTESLDEVFGGTGNSLQKPA